MMESLRKMSILVITIGLTMQLSLADTRYYAKVPRNSTNTLRRIVGLDGSRMINHQDENGGRGVDMNNRAVSPVLKTRSTFRIDDETMIRESLKANLERRNSFVESSTFDPDVLNKFLDDYANKIKSTTERNYNFPFRATISNNDQQLLNDDNRVGSSSLKNEKENETNKTMENSINATLESVVLNQQELNDTIKRNKYYGANSNDDRNGWVTLEAIPWSKSKISKWQASSSSQRPWPEMKVWEKPNGGKPWTSEFPSRPAYINNEPWHESPKPQRPDYQSDRPSSLRPQASTRPSYFDDRFDDNTNQAQKWPPERPPSSWEKFPSSDSYRPSSDIITDDRPSNFPSSNWDKYSDASNNNNNNKPTYSYNDRDRYESTNNYDKNHHHHHQHHQHQNENQDWPSDHQNNNPSKFEHFKNKPTNFGRPNNNDQNDHYNNNNYNRPQHLSHYQYTPDHHPPSHPSSGEGQWVLLSTNRGYSKSRQRSIKLDTTDDNDGKTSQTNATLPARTTKQENDGTVAVMTSKRQVRLTVLPSVNGTNTTTSHGGLLEVERTFKTVDQSQKEYEEEASKLTSIRPQILKKRPIRNTIVGRPPSNSAVLAAVGAGMLPATMAMMIPMMLGRKKRSPKIETISRQLFHNGKYNKEFSTDREKFGKRRNILRLEEK